MGSRHGSISSSVDRERIRGGVSLPSATILAGRVGDAACHRIGLSSILKPVMVIGDVLIILEKCHFSCHSTTRIVIMTKNTPLKVLHFCH